MHKPFAIALLSAAYSLPCAAQTAATQEALTYEQAKARADKDEARLENLTKRYVLDAQEKLLDQIAMQCAAPDVELKPFTIVVEVGEDSRAIRTWRQGDTGLARCFEQQMLERPLLNPPLAPWFVSFEVSFTPD